MIVEGNCMADPDVTQMPDGKGKWPMYVPILKAVEKVEEEKVNENDRFSD